MKILKIKIKLVDGPNDSVVYCYPVNCEAHNINILAYSEEHLEQDGKFSHCIGLVDDNFSTDLPSEIICEINKEEANQLGQKWRPPIMKITNQKLVNDIIARLKNGIPLTWMEIKALDPYDKQAAGINYSKEFNINDYLPT